jgi:predicted N-acetyltransferase YhbS
VIIRLERADDRDASFEIERLAFKRDLEAEIARTVANEEGSFALVAEDGDTMIGHVQMSRGWVGATPVLALGPIGVLPERQGQGWRGAGARRARGGRPAGGAGRDAARVSGVLPPIRLRSGLHLRPEEPLRWGGRGGFEIAEEDFMVARLDEAPLALEGCVRWHPAFDEAG